VIHVTASYQAWRARRLPQRADTFVKELQDAMIRDEIRVVLAQLADQNPQHFDIVAVCPALRFGG
jgi:hypothetical protein